MTQTEPQTPTLLKASCRLLDVLEEQLTYDCWENPDIIEAVAVVRQAITSLDRAMLRNSRKDVS